MDALIDITDLERLEDRFGLLQRECYEVKTFAEKIELEIRGSRGTDKVSEVSTATIIRPQGENRIVEVANRVEDVRGLISQVRVSLSYIRTAVGQTPNRKER